VANPPVPTPPSVPAASHEPPKSAAQSGDAAPILNEPAEAALANEARQILVQASSNAWAALRAHSLEASIGHPSLLADLAPKALVDENRGVRFVACMSIAEMRDARFNPLVAPLLSDPSASVRAAAMLALSRGGQRVNFTPLADMLADNDPEIRANAYLVLGELGNESAIPLIRESLGRGMKLVNPLRVRLVDLAAAEALVKLGDEKEVEPIRAALFAPPEQGELTIVACDSVRRLKDEVARPMLERIVSARGSVQRSAEIRLAACRALHALGSSGAPLAVAREYANHPDARIRAQSTVLLGEIGSPEARALLSGLLHDADPTVQVAAAGGLDPEGP
jgi:HEAT repeat protein